ncbi:MAG TPA: tetratricopeptide repeat protein [Syntrophales bacterium]|nr:tetratricopeptide repeat protein [Syntrophales bacterium]
MAVPKVKIKNLFELANSAFDDGNYQEANDYFTEMLEFDPENYEAHLGKGLSAGWLSTIANNRIGETTEGFIKAINYSPEDKKEEVIKRGLSLILDLTTNYYKQLKAYVDDAFLQVKGRLKNSRVRIDVIAGLGNTYYRRLRDLVVELNGLSPLLPNSEKIKLKKMIIFLCMQGINYKKLNPMQHEVSFLRNLIEICDYEIKKCNLS